MSIGRHKLKLALVAFGVVVCAASCPLQARAENAFEAGKEELKLKRYHSAKEKFMAAVQQNPSNQKAYLYLGRCLEYLREFDDAQACYRACFTVNPFSEDGKRAKQFSMDIAGRSEAMEHRAVDSPQDVIDSGLLIQRQSLDLQARKVREAEGYARNRRAVNRRQGYFYTPYDLTRRREEQSNMDMIRNGNGIYDNTIEAARARLHGQNQAQSVQDTANWLIERLGRKNHSSAPALRALGTNLYVQYYRSKNEEEDVPPPPDPPIELRAKQLKYDEIPKAWRAQSKIFKFPTISADEIEKSRKPESVEEALFDDLSAPQRRTTETAVTKPAASTPPPPAAPSDLPAEGANPKPKVWNDTATSPENDPFSQPLEEQSKSKIWTLDAAKMPASKPGVEATPPSRSGVQQF